MGTGFIFNSVGAREGKGEEERQRKGGRRSKRGKGRGRETEKGSSEQESKNLKNVLNRAAIDTLLYTKQLSPPIKVLL